MLFVVLGFVVLGFVVGLLYGVFIGGWTLKRVDSSLWKEINQSEVPPPSPPTPSLDKPGELDSH